MSNIVKVKVARRGGRGRVGDSSYQAWLDAGNTGSQADFLASVSRFANFASRAELAAYSSANPEKMRGALFCVGGVFFERSEGATAIPSLPGFIPSGEITPFHFGTGAAGWQVEINAASAYAAATGRNRVAIPAAVRPRLSLSGPISPVSGVEIFGVGNPELEISASTLFYATAVVGFVVRDVTVIGPYTGTSYVATLGTGCQRCVVDLTFVGTNSGTAVINASDNILRIAGRNVRGTLLKLEGTGAVRNHVERVVAENVSGFGMYLAAGASENRVDLVRKFVNLADLPADQQAGTQWDPATGRVGLEALGVTIGCNHNSFGSIVAISTHDNGVSITGDYNTIEDITAENCDHDGVHLYGSYNVVGFIRGHGNRMSGAGAGGSSTQGGGSYNSVMNGVCIENGYNAVRFSAPSDFNDFRVRSINNALGDYYAVAEAGAGNRFNPAQSPLDTSSQAVIGDAAKIVQTVTGSAAVPEVAQVKIGTGGIDVASGTTLARWSAAGLLGGVVQAAARISVLAASASTFLRAKMRFEVVNAEGVIRPAMVIDSEGRIGIAKRSATVEYSPLAELDVDGATRLSSATLKAMSVADYAGAALDVSYASALHIAPVDGGATLGVISSTAPGQQLLVIKNTNSQPLTIPHSSSGVRTASGKNIVLGAYKSVLLIQAGGAVWDEVGVFWPSASLSTDTMQVEGVTDSIQQTIVADAGSPILNQRRRLASGNGDVQVGSVLAKWTGAGFLNGAYRFGYRFTVYVASAVGDIVRAKAKINVTNAAGVDWPAFHFSEEGYLGIGDSVAFTEKDPACPLDVDGHSRLRSLALVNSDVADYAGAAFDATGKSVLSIGSLATGTVLGAVSTSSVGFHLLVIRNTSSNTLIVPYSANGFRLNGKADLTLGAHEAILLIHLTGTIWQQVGK